MCTKPSAPSDLVKHAIKFGYLDSAAKAVVLRNSNTHLCEYVYITFINYYLYPPNITIKTCKAVFCLIKFRLSA